MENMQSINIDNIKRKTLIKYSLFGTVIASIKLKEKNDLKTLGTDGKTIYYDPKFLEKLTEEEQVFVFAHEVCHIAFNHVLKSEGKNQKIWNLATDAVINQFLKKDHLPMVKGGVDIAEAINYDSETLYEKMMKEKEEQKEQKNNQKGNSSQSSQDQNKSDEQQSNQGQNEKSDGNNQNQSQSNKSDSDEESDFSDNDSQKSEEQNSNEQQEEDQDVGHDTHSMWPEAVKRFKAGKDFDDEQEEDKQNKTQDEMADEKIKQVQDKMDEMGEKTAFKKNEQIRKEQLEELLDSLSKESKCAGASTDSEIREMKDIGVHKPLIDWRLLLREATSMDVDWSYQNAEIEHGVMTPHLETYSKPETEILLDTSGSISQTLLKNFLRECKNIFQESRVKVGCFDTEFYGWNEIRTLENIDDMEYIGGGGTNFQVAVNAFTRRVENKIIFTDGKAFMPDTPINAIWVVFGNKKISPLGGRVIYINEEELKRLCYLEENTKRQSR